MQSIFKLSQSPFIVLVGLLLFCLFTNCEDYLEAEDPVGQINTSSVFNNENTATAAVTTLYGMLRDQVLLTGTSNGMTILMGLYADELDFYSAPGDTERFYTHQIAPDNLKVEELWSSAYHLIFMCNAALEGVEKSESLSEEVKSKLSGEALFIRAVVHFYLVNLFGDIPYISTTDYIQNTTVVRMNEVNVYEEIVRDLLEAKNLLTTDYPTGERIRANKYVVAAFLARVYLYLGQWQMAEEASTFVINNLAFELESELNNEFLKESTSAIWQLKPKNEGDNTLEAASFIFSSGPPPFVALTHLVVEDMEEGDLRKESWVRSVSDGIDTWYYPYKYKQNLNTGTTLEYSIVMRLSEQYLIRAEAQIMQGDLNGAARDLNKIRTRAGLAEINTSSSEVLLEAIIKEKKVELFSEYGHRWFDIKRWGIAGSVLTPIKPGWQAKNILLPIPESELLINPNLEPQNPGY